MLPPLTDQTALDRAPRLIDQATRVYFGGGGNIGSPPAPPPPPSQFKAADLVAQQRQQSQSKRRQGYGSTLLTSAMGVATQAPLAKTLLGQ